MPSAWHCSQNILPLSILIFRLPHIEERSAKPKTQGDFARDGVKPRWRHACLDAPREHCPSKSSEFIAAKLNPQLKMHRRVSGWTPSPGSSTGRCFFPNLKQPLDPPSRWPRSNLDLIVLNLHKNCWWGEDAACRVSRCGGSCLPSSATGSKVFGGPATSLKVLIGPATSSRVGDTDPVDVWWLIALSRIYFALWSAGKLPFDLWHFCFSYSPSFWQLRFKHRAHEPRHQESTLSPQIQNGWGKISQPWWWMYLLLLTLHFSLFRFLSLFQHLCLLSPQWKRELSSPPQYSREKDASCFYF